MPLTFSCLVLGVKNGISSQSSSLMSVAWPWPPPWPPRLPPFAPEAEPDPEPDPEPDLEPPPLLSDLPPKNWMLSATTSIFERLEPSWASQVRYCRRPSTRMGSPFFL